MTADSRQSAVIVPVPAAEPAVGSHRRRLDPSAAWGVPAHITVIYPFVPPTQLDAAVVDRLRAAVAVVPAFGCVLARARWFGDDVVWLAPDPDGPFRDLTAAVWRAFPQHPPYGGAFDDVVPHLTVGESRRGEPAELRAAEAAVSAHLPIPTYVDRAALIAGREAPGSWRTVAELPLGPGPEPRTRAG